MAENQVIKTECFESDKPTAAGLSELVKAFVLSKELKHDQIIKIAMMQSGAGEKTDLRCILIYKETSTEESVPIADLKVKVYPTKKAWSTTLAAAKSDIDEGDKCVVDVVHYPRNFGSDRQQILFYTSQAQNDALEFNIKHIKDNSKQWPEFLNDVRSWLNQYVAPHLLVSVSIFEDEHPCKGGLNCVIVHSDDASDVAKAHDRDIYKLDKFDKLSTDLWKDCYKEMAESINKANDGRASLIAGATVT
jgi:hypothetical protein